MNDVRIRSGGQRQVASILTEPDKVSTKRLAWAFGCAKKDSDEERALYKLLRERMVQLAAERGEIP